MFLNIFLKIFMELFDILCSKTFTKMLLLHKVDK